jgi:hypothetical protein
MEWEKKQIQKIPGSLPSPRATFSLKKTLLHLSTIHKRNEKNRGRRHGCQIFLGTTYQNGEKNTKWPQNKYTKWRLNISNGHKINQVLIKYTKVFYCKTHQNLPALGVLVWKQTIWQPWSKIRRLIKRNCCFRVKLADTCPITGGAKIFSKWQHSFSGQAAT